MSEKEINCPNGCDDPSWSAIVHAAVKRGSGETSSQTTKTDKMYPDI